jgi:hypothetical protein
MKVVNASIIDLNTTVSGLSTNMANVDVKLARMQTNFGSVFEAMVRFEQIGFRVEDWAQTLVVDKPSVLFWYCSTSESFDKSAALQKVLSHIEGICPDFLLHFVTTVLRRQDYDIFLEAQPGTREKVEYLNKCLKELKTEKTLLEKGKGVKKSDLENCKHSVNTMECIVNSYFQPDINRRFDSKLGLMILLWSTDMKTILRSLEIDMRGNLRVEGFESIGDISMAAASLTPPAGSSHAKKIIAFMGECKMSRRARHNAVAQLTIRLKLLRSFLLAAEFASAGKDWFFLEGRVYLPAGTQATPDPATIVDRVNNTELRMTTIISSISSFTPDGASSGSE